MPLFCFPVWSTDWWILYIRSSIPWNSWGHINSSGNQTVQMILQTFDMLAQRSNYFGFYGSMFCIWSLFMAWLAHYKNVEIQKYSFMRGQGRVFASGAWDGARGVEPTKPCDSFSCIHPQFDFWYFLCVFVLFWYFWFCLVRWGPRSWVEPGHETLRFIPCIHHNLLSKRALSYSSQCQQHHPYHCQCQRENKEVTN